MTGTDETDLLLPLFGAMHENPRFSGFLSRLLRRTGAHSISIVLRHGDATSRMIESFHAGVDLRQKARDMDLEDPADLDRVQYDMLRPGRVYSIGELVDHDPVARVERARKMMRLGIADERVVRLIQSSDLSAWLTMARTSACSAADSALLSSLVPYVKSSIETMMEIDRAQLHARIATSGLDRCGKGWMLFDREGHLVSIDPATAGYWEAAGGGHPRIGERLRGLEPGTERTLAAAILAASEPQSLLLKEHPRIELLLTPFAGDRQAVALGLCTLPAPRAANAVERLRSIFGLPPREAELALNLADGLSIAEAGSAMGLTLETTRNYSKKLYARMGVRGQPELVRAVLQSTASLQ